jgi:hypothetical protein
VSVKKMTEADKIKAQQMRDGTLPWPTVGASGKAEADKRFGNGRR